MGFSAISIFDADNAADYSMMMTTLAMAFVSRGLVVRITRWFIVFVTARYDHRDESIHHDEKTGRRAVFFRDI